MNDLVEETKNELHQKINKSKDAENAEEKRIVEEITRRETEVKTAEVQRSKLLDEQKMKLRKFKILTRNSLISVRCWRTKLAKVVTVGTMVMLKLRQISTK